MTVILETVKKLTAATAVATAAATASNPTAPAAYTKVATGSAITVTTNDAADLTTTSAALEALRDECATYETAISANIIDMAAIAVIVDNLVLDLAAMRNAINFGR